MVENSQFKLSAEELLNDILRHGAAKTTIDPFLLFLKKEDIQEIEDWLKEKQRELIKHENGSRV